MVRIGHKPYLAGTKFLLSIFKHLHYNCTTLYTKTGEFEECIHLKFKFLEN